MRTFDTIFTALAALAGAVLAAGAVIRGRNLLALWSFAIGMLLLSAVSVFDCFLLESERVDEAAFWERASLWGSLAVPFVWAVFALSYSRGNWRESLQRARFVLVAVLIIPVGAAVWGGGGHVEAAPSGETGWWLKYDRSLVVLSIVFIGSYALILSQLERTLRAAIGTSRWRIKFAVLGIGFIFIARLFTTTQDLLYSGRASELIVIESIGMIVGCVFISIGYFRRAFEGISVFPSRALLQGSVTILLVGGYLVASGVAARLAINLGALTTVRSQALIILLAIAVLACFLVSDRSQQHIATFITRHFRLPIHDYRQVWTKLTRILSGASNEKQVAHDVAELLSQTFEALSVSVWISTQARKTFVLQGSTRESVGTRMITSPLPVGYAFDTSRPIELEGIGQSWAMSLRERCAPQFPNGGKRLVLPLIANQGVIGLIVLGDRVNGRPYLADEHDLLECIGEQVAAAIYRISSTAELVQSKEMEAFQSMSAFFVHDLKNAASSLSLALENLPTHFHDPEFREDALRVVRRTVQRIKELIARLSTLRTQLEVCLSDVDLNALVTQVLGEIPQEETISLSHDLAPLPLVRADRNQLHSVITNLLLNARDAISSHGHIRVETSAGNGCAVLSISDDGCGMPSEFVQQSLFRPFQSTKTSGLGIGMYQSKQIVKAHSGSIEVETAVGEGTRFLVTLPTAIQSA